MRRSLDGEPWVPGESTREGRMEAAHARERENKVEGNRRGRVEGDRGRSTRGCKKHPRTATKGEPVPLMMASRSCSEVGATGSGLRR